jgi:hypothetical protein
MKRNQKKKKKEKEGGIVFWLERSTRTARPEATELLIQTCWSFYITRRDRRRMGGGCTLTLNKRRTGAGFKSSRRLEGPSEAMQVALLQVIYFISFFFF